MPLLPIELKRYSRHLSLSEFGIAGQEKLKAASVIVIGAGGLGSPALLYLAAAGVGTIGIVDFDKVDISNLQRQVLFTEADVGKSKADVASTRLKSLNPHIVINSYAIELKANNVMDLLSQYDVVIDGCDRFVTRYLVNDACVLLHKPLVSAAIHRFEGQAFTCVPRQGPCYRCLFPEQPSGDLIPNCATAGVLGVLPGIMGSIQATEAIKLITGMGTPLIGRLLTYDALDMHFAEFEFARRHDCAVCGDDPTITTPSELAESCAAFIEDGGITAIALQALLASTSANDLQLIDVRDQHEYLIGHLPHSINLPLSTLAAQLPSMDSHKKTIFICRSGVRSQQACQLATQLGLMDVTSLCGGLQQWNDKSATDQRCNL